MANPGAQAPRKQNTYTDEEIAALAAYVASLGPGPAIPTEEQYSGEGLSPEELAKDAQWSSIQGTNDQKAQLYFDKYGAYPKTQHRICGMRPVEDPNGKISVGGKTYRMERFWKEDRVFLEKHYLFPIPTEELQRANIPQNPNW